MPNLKELAPQIYGRDFLGEEVVKEVFLPQAKSAPKPALSPQELVLAESKARGEFLLHMVNTAPDGSPLTMHRIQELLQERFDQTKAGKILYDTTWYQDEAFFMEETPKAGLVVVSKVPIAGSTDRTYHGQTQVLVDYIKGVFEGRDLSKTAQEGIRQWEKEKAKLAKLQDSNWREAAKELLALVINQSFRERMVEAMQSVLVPFVVNNERRLQNQFIWTNSLASDGSLMGLGRCDPDGLLVRGWNPSHAFPLVGVCFSAAIEDLVYSKI